MTKVYECKMGVLSFTRGKFDEWCVHVSGHYLPQYPKDEWYFMKLKDYKESLNDLVYEDFKYVYLATTKELDEKIFESIKKLSKNYPNPDEAEAVFSVLYMTMLAEENKQGAILRKRIKRLGVHQVLVENMTPKKAASFSKGKPAIELAKECWTRGF